MLIMLFWTANLEPKSQYQSHIFDTSQLKVELLFYHMTLAVKIYVIDFRGYDIVL